MEMICVRCDRKMKRVGGGLDKFTTYVEYKCPKCGAHVRYYF